MVQILNKLFGKNNEDLKRASTRNAYY